MSLIDQLSDPRDTSERLIESIGLKDAMRKLNAREKKILHLRYDKGHTQTEVAREIGISQAQVSRLEKGALSRVRAQL